MSRFLKELIDSLSNPRRVEFDYHDSTGCHHGRCYVRCVWTGDRQIERILRSFGYTNIRID